MPSYVPILKWKQGEQKGLRQMTPAAKIGCIPLIELLEELKRSRELNRVCSPEMDHGA